MGLGSQWGWDFEFPTHLNIRKIKRKIDVQIDVKIVDVNVNIYDFDVKIQDPYLSVSRLLWFPDTVAICEGPGKILKNENGHKTAKH